MIEQTYHDVCTPELLQGAINNTAHEGFLVDYHVLHSLLRKYQPKRFFEIGTCNGLGTKIIKNALGADSHVISLDLPKHLCHPSLQVPMGGQESDCVGYLCTLPYEQVRGNSMNYDYTQHYPIDGWFVDGDHDGDAVFHDATEAICSEAKLIIFHDCDGEPVLNGILRAKEAHPNGEEYEFFRVLQTRIGYLLLK